MTDAKPAAESEHRLPIAYSQGFAHIRVFAVSDPYDVGPLRVPEPLDHDDAAEVSELLRAD